MARLEFPAKIKDAAIARANGRCQDCGMPFAGKKPEIDHILPCALGGQPTLANARAICGPCHKAKTAADVKGIRKADRQRRSHIGADAAPKTLIKSRGFPPSGKPAPKVAKQELPPRALYKDTTNGQRP
jgi:5-methylcytosine-specific restriction endonuclease McrA